MSSNREKLSTPEYQERLLEFSKKLCEERKKLGISQAKLAKLAGLSSHAVISRWEAVASSVRDSDYLSKGAVARELPDVNDLLKLCNVFGCDIEYLLGLQELPTKAMTDISKVTGFSETEIRSLMEIWTYAQAKRGNRKDRQNPFYNAHAALKKLLANNIPGLVVLSCINLYFESKGAASINDLAYDLSELKEEDVALTAITKELTHIKREGVNNGKTQEKR